MNSRIQVVLGMAVAAALVVIGVVLWVDHMTPVMITIEAAEEHAIRVDVSGEVRTPGVVNVPVGARLMDVVDAAGGFTDDAATDVLNLAGRVGDGEQVVIPRVGQTDAIATMPVAVDQLINLNTATVDELDELPGIGDVLGGRIVAYRDENGAFRTVDELAEIEGISPRLVDEIRPYVTVGP